jgi:magnesium-transporting ATPase (P-type)
MKNPELYKIGPNQECISYPIFIYWIVYGMIQSFMCYWLGMVVLSSPGFTSTNGEEMGLWLCGNVAFGLSVMIANVVIFLKFYVHHWLSLVSVILMFMAYFVFFVGESNFFYFKELYLLFP